tara:strand:- start:69 stop:320 length:252 start_codon:yes stop_codon:yes gene_type:complete
MKTYAVIKLEDLEKVDFNQIIEGSENTIRKNILEPPTQFGIKWSGKTPSFISDGSVSVVGDIMNHEEALALMATDAWSEPMPE